MSKGSGRRPAAISAQEFAEKWAQTFGKKDAFMASYRFSFKVDTVRDNHDGTYTTSDGRIIGSFGEVIADAAKEVVREMHRSLNRAEANADAPPPNEEDAP